MNRIYRDELARAAPAQVRATGSDARKSDDRLSIQKVCKSFRTPSGELPALKNIGLSVQSGEFICIVGGSGCGKTTLLRVIAGLERDYSGAVLLGGERLAGPGLDRGFVFQEHRLLPWLTISENVGFGLLRLPSRERRETIRHYLELVGLAEFENSYPHQLSGGMAQRVAIARALANRPQVLLLDEPLGALDAFTRIRMQQEILRIWEAERTTMLLVTHDIEEAVFLADRVVVLSPQPGTVRKTVSIDLGRPRDRNSEDFIRIRKPLHGEFFDRQERSKESAV